MACTFNGLDLESLGTVGDQEVEYASFQTELSSPQGHDGDVLSNFRRGPTTVKFNLAMDGTPAELTAKMNRLAEALSGGMGELVMPDQTEGFHLDAVPNCTMRPSVYHDGFVLPLEFVVPDGAATGGTEIIRFYPPETPGGVPTSYDVVVTGPFPVDWEIVSQIDIPAGSTTGWDLTIYSEDEGVVTDDHPLSNLPRGTARVYSSSGLLEYASNDLTDIRSILDGFPRLKPGRYAIVCAGYNDTIEYRKWSLW